MMNQKVIIIGGGLAGLSAGIELQKKGIRSEIFEKAPWVGGVCTSWVRNGYRFDGCIHWMVGTNPNSSFFKIYEQVKALDEAVTCFHPESILLEYNGERYDIPMETEAFFAFLGKLNEGDEKYIIQLQRALKLFLTGGMPAGNPTSIFGLIAFPFKYFPFTRLMMKYGGKTINDFTKGMKSKKLKMIIKHLMPGEFSVLALIMMLSMRFTRNGGYPEGGSLDVIKRMESYYKELGGTIHLNSEVTEIIREGRIVTGIRSKNKVFQADAFISAGDAHNLLYVLLKEPSLHRQLERYLNEDGILFSPISIVSFGLKKQLGIPYSILFESTEEPLIPGERKINSLSVRSFDFDKTAAPKGKSSVMVMIGDSLEYWQSLRERDLSEYKNEKDNLAKKVAEYLNTKYPSFSESIEVVDVATPATYVRLANLHKASFEGFLPLPRLIRKSIKRELDGIDNLILTGQWVTPGGGIPPAISSGIQAADTIKRKLRGKS
ncbi:MAG: NAD(P)/FAD-dependent oxidoreductase [Bacilli bacterium]|nr:NAD(P)/FAD-dependent oxidoreductase [Bacilli bacterium]